MTLAVFDLDNTILEGDSDSAWFHFLVEKKAVANAFNIAIQNEGFYQDYLAGKLNFSAYVKFAFGILHSMPMVRLKALRKIYFKEKIIPMIRPLAVKCIESHRKRGHELILSTATNNFITEPISNYLKMDHLIATQLEIKEGGFSGKIYGTANIQKGKVENLLKWMKAHPRHQLATTYFYGDSINDKALLMAVGYPRVVDPDELLAEIARKKRWRKLSFKLH